MEQKTDWNEPNTIAITLPDGPKIPHMHAHSRIYVPPPPGIQRTVMALCGADFILSPPAEEKDAEVVLFFSLLLFQCFFKTQTNTEHGMLEKEVSSDRKLSNSTFQPVVSWEYRGCEVCKTIRS
jgi:hypothetical protein